MFIVQLKIFSFNLILNIEYVQYLLNFFVLPNQDAVIGDTTKNAKQIITVSNIYENKDVCIILVHYLLIYMEKCYRKKNRTLSNKKKTIKHFYSKYN